MERQGSLLYDSCRAQCRVDDKENEVKQWTADNPKAALMARKRAVIVEAARLAFLDKGYAESSMGRIAEAAGVSIKTVYRHFENKDDLFSAVMHAACDPNGIAELESEPVPEAPAADTAAVPPRPWARKAPAAALPLAGVDYLNDLLEPEKLSLYRVVARDAHRFPELGLRYQAEISARRIELMADYLEQWSDAEKWKIKNSRRAAATFLALLRADLFDDALFGIRLADKKEIAAQARTAAALILQLLQSHSF
jgi:TetR/AcrR family transcriptional repressor of mexJK operon